MISISNANAISNPTMSVLNAQAGDRDHVNGLIEGSEKVQEEDVGLCAEVQLGLASPAYDVGR